MSTPIQSTSSAFKHRSTKSRSIKKVEDALPKSPHKRKEVVSALAKMQQLRIEVNKGGRPEINLTEEQKRWLRKALDRPYLSMINPGKKDNVYIGKVDGERRYEQKRYLLWPMRDILKILNMSNAEESQAQTFDHKLSFRMLHPFLNEHKQYIYNKRIPHSTCFCEICENTVLLSKGIARAFPSNITTNPHTIAEHYSCDSDAAECMLGQCDECNDHGLKPEDFEKTLSKS